MELARMDRVLGEQFIDDSVCTWPIGQRQFFASRTNAIFNLKSVTFIKKKFAVDCIEGKGRKSNNK